MEVHLDSDHLYLLPFCTQKVSPTTRFECLWTSSVLALVPANVSDICNRRGMLTLLFSLLQRCGCARRSAGFWGTPTSAGCHRCPLPPPITEVTCSSLGRSSSRPSSSCSCSSSSSRRRSRASRKIHSLVTPARRRRASRRLVKTARARRSQGTPVPPLSSLKWAASSSACCLPRWMPTRSAMRWIAPTRWSAGRDICQPRL